MNVIQFILNLNEEKIIFLSCVDVVNDVAQTTIVAPCDRVYTCNVAHTDACVQTCMCTCARVCACTCARVSLVRLSIIFIMN